MAATVTAGASAAAGDETVTADGLEWALRTNGSDIRWPDAIDYCHALELAGHADWRLPSMDELKSLHDPQGAGGFSSPLVIDTCCLWSGESLEHRPVKGDYTAGGPPNRYHWGYMFDGGIEYYAVDIFEDGQALCVRHAD